MEGKKTRHQEILESIQGASYKQTYLEWYNIGASLNEAKLTQDQIQKIFAAIDAGAREGKNVDPKGYTTPSGTIPKRGILGSINNAWLKFKDKIAQSGPVSGFDVAFDKLQGKVLSAAGGEKGMVGKALQKYKDFATKYPKMQGAIYAGVAILAGLSGWGLGGAAILGGIRTIDRLLQGDRLSSALWKGFKAGAVSAAAGEIGKALGGGGGGGAEPAPSDFGPGDAPGNTSYTVQSGDTLSDIAQRTGTSVDQLMKANPQLTNPDVLRAGQDINLVGSTGQSVYQGGVGTAADTMNKINTGQYTDSPISRTQYAKAMTKESIDVAKIRRNWELQSEMKLPLTSAVYLTQYGVTRIFEAVERKNIINEGMWDSIKGAVKSGVDTFKNKITKDKLDNFWRRNFKEYSQADSVDSTVVRDFLRRMGVKDGLTDQVFKELQIPLDNATPASTASNPNFGVAGSTTPKLQGNLPTSAASASSTAPATGGTPAKGGTDMPTKPFSPPSAITPKFKGDTGSSASSAASATGAAKSAETPAATKSTGPTVGQEIELPGTNFKFKYNPQWVTDDGRIASDASAKVLNQLASGTSKADIDSRDLVALRRQPVKGSPGMMPENRRKFAESKKRKLK